MPHYLVQQGNGSNIGLSIAQVNNHEEAARLHFAKVELHDRHRLCMSTGTLRLTVSRIGLIGPLCSVSDSRVYSVSRVGNDIVAVYESSVSSDQINLVLTGPHASDAAEEVMG